jgi:hypothetical protein
VRNLITARFAGAVGTSGIPVLDLAASYEKLGDFITAKIGPEVGGYGLELLQLLVENVSLPPEVEQALDKRTSMGVIGDLGRYAQFQAAEAMRDAARNPGAAGASLGVIVGAGLGQQVGPWGAAQPSPAPAAARRHGRTVLRPATAAGAATLPRGRRWQADGAVRVGRTHRAGPGRPPHAHDPGLGRGDGPVAPGGRGRGSRPPARGRAAADPAR